MTRLPNPSIEIFEVDHASGRLVLFCCWDKDNDRSSSVSLGGWFEYERSCGIDTVFTDEGDDLLDHLPPELYLSLLNRCISLFDAERWLRDHLSETEREEGIVFRSRYPVDHDALAKEQRMRDEEDFPPPNQGDNHARP